MEIDQITEKGIKNIQEENIKISSKQMKRLIKKLNPEKLFGTKIWLKFENDSLTNSINCLRDIFHTTLSPIPCEIETQFPNTLILKQRLLFLLKFIQDHINSVEWVLSIDNGEFQVYFNCFSAFSFLLLILLNDDAKLRLKALKMISEFCKLNQTSSNSKIKSSRLFMTNLCKSSTFTTDKVNNMLESEVTSQLINAESLKELHMSLPYIVDAVMKILGCEDIELYPECWVSCLSLFSESTLPTILSTQNNLWNKYMVVLKQPKNLIRKDLYTQARTLLNETFFHGLLVRSDEKISDFQKQLLTALLEGIINENDSSNSIESLLNSEKEHSNNLVASKVFDQLKMNSVHFNFCFEFLENRRHFQGTDNGLKSRLKAARDRRKSNLVSLEEDRYINSTLAYLRGLELISCVLANSIPELHRLQMRALNEGNSSEIISSNAPSAYVKLTSITPKNSFKEDLFSRKIENASSALANLIQPIVNQILVLAEEERDPAYSKLRSNENSETFSESDDGFETEEDESGFVLPMSFLEMTPGSNIYPITPSVSKTKTPQSKLYSNVNSIRQRASLIKICIHQLVGCLGQIFAQANQERRQIIASASAELKKTRYVYKIIQIANKAVSEGSMANAKYCIQPIFLCIDVFPSWPPFQHQILFCLIELAALFPLALCEHLMHFVRWVTASTKNKMMRLDDSHSLSLIGRLVSVAIPSLVESSKQPPLVALDVLLTFVDNFVAFADLSSSSGRNNRNFARRRMALYCGVIHGLARACVPVNLARNLEEGTLRDEEQSRQALELMHVVALRTEKQSKKGTALSTWLWIAATFFINRDWPEIGIADSVSSFLIKMFNEFSLNIQISSWCQCLAYMLYLSQSKVSVEDLSETSTIKDPTLCSKRPRISEPLIPESGLSEPQTPVRRSKRLRMISTSLSPSANDDHGLDLSHIPMNRRRRTTSVNEPDIDHTRKKQTSGFSTPLMEVQNFCESECMRLTRLLYKQNDPHESEIPMECYPINSSALKRSQNTPIKDVTSSIYTHWSLISRMCQLLSAVLSSPTHTRRLEQNLKEGSEIVSDLYGRLVYHAIRLLAQSSKKCQDTKVVASLKEIQNSLQNSLIKIQECVRPTLYIRMLSDLLDKCSLVRDSQTLVRRLLELLASKLNHLMIITKGRSSSHRLDKSLEETLVNLNERCHKIFIKTISIPTDNVSSNILKALLTCFLHLIQLLSRGYPQDCLKIVEATLQQPTVWWPHFNSKNSDQPNGVNLAEARSLLCQFLTKSLEHLGFWMHARWHSIGLKMLQIAIDHCTTAARISDRPLILHEMLALPNFLASEGIDTQIECNFVAGTIHYRDQHLLAGMIILFQVMQFSVIKQFTLCQRALYCQNSSRTTQTSYEELEQCLDKTSAITESSALLQFRPEGLPMIHQAVKKSYGEGSSQIIQIFSGHLLVLVCRLSSLDIIQATGCKPERSAVQLSQLNQLIFHLKFVLLQSPGITHTFFTIYTLFKYSTKVCDWELFIGIVQLLKIIGLPLPVSFPIPQDSHIHPELLTGESRLQSVLLHKPELLFHLNKLLLNYYYFDYKEVNTSIFTKCCNAVSAIIKTIPSHQDASSMLKKLLIWAPSLKEINHYSVDMDIMEDEFSSQVGIILHRINSLLNVFSMLAPTVISSNETKPTDSSPEIAKFVELCRNSELPSLILDLLALFTESSKKKLLKKISTNSFLREFCLLLIEKGSDSVENKREFAHPARFNPTNVIKVIESLLTTLTYWFKSEHIEGDNSLTTLLSSLFNKTSYSDISNFSIFIVGLLDLCQNPEEDSTPLLQNPFELLSPVIDAYLDLAMNDEVLIRPLCQALCQRLLCSGSESGGMYGISHWKTRLASIQLLRRLYEHILETKKLGHEALDSNDRENRIERLSTVSCMVNDTLAGLQEALQDDRAEVEEAANNLFADLETAGVLSR